MRQANQSELVLSENKVLKQSSKQWHDWVDYTRGFGMIAVIFAHSQLPRNLFKLIAFVIVLFPFLSGYLHKATSLKTLIQKRQQLVISYYYMGLINYLVWILLIPEQMRKADNLTYLKNFLLVKSDLFSEIPLSIIPLWYLIYLFFADIIYYVARKTKLLYPLIIFGFLSRFYFPGAMPFKLDVVFASLYIFEFGRLFREKDVQVKHYIGLLSSIILGIVAQINDGVDWNCDRYGKNPILALIGEITMILVVVWIMQIIENKSILKKSFGKLFKRFSENSLFILGYHILLGGLFIIFLMLLGFNVTEENIQRYWYVTFLIMFFSTYISIIIIPSKVKAFLTILSIQTKKGKSK